MGTIVLYIMLFMTGAAAFFRPWIGVVAYFTLSIWYPQLIWYWAFQTIKAPFIIAVFTVIGFGINTIMGKADLTVLRRKEFIYIVFLWVSLVISHFFGAYGTNESASWVYNSKILLETFTKTFFFYGLALVLIDDQKKFHYLIIIFMVVIVYYVYWANERYLSGRMMMYGPRLSGPGLEALESTGHGGGPYTDENNFAMLFVIGIPFLYFMGNYYKNWIVKGLLWGAIPFAWHAIFLTGSMGGMIGLSVVSIFIMIRAKRKLFMVGLPIALVAAIIWQGGAFLKGRISEQSDSLRYDPYGISKQETTADQRFNSWWAGLMMVTHHPVTGVGLGNFLRAYPDFSETNPHVAHNTFLQLAAEAGFLAGLIYLLLFWGLLKTYFRQIRLKTGHSDPFYTASSESIAGGASGFFICALFLNLATYELLYYILVLSSIQGVLISSGNREFTDHVFLTEGAA